MNLQEFCELAIEESNPSNIPYFAHWGEEDLGITWAYTFSHHRDSDILDESNWEVITNDMCHRFPEDTQIESASHWAVGWVEQLLVRMLDKDGRPTEAAAAALEWKEALESYPVADEEDYSRREWEDALETLQWCVSPDEAPDDWPEILMRELLDRDWYYESDSGGTYWTHPSGNDADEEITKVMRELGWMDEEEV